MAHDLNRNDFIKRIDSLITSAGRSDRSVSIEATGSVDLMRNIRSVRSKWPRVDNVVGLAKALNTTLNYLLFGDEAAKVPATSIDVALLAEVIIEAERIAKEYNWTTEPLVHARAVAALYEHCVNNPDVKPSESESVFKAVIKVASNP